MNNFASSMSAMRSGAAGFFQPQEQARKGAVSQKEGVFSFESALTDSFNTRRSFSAPDECAERTDCFQPDSYNGNDSGSEPRETASEKPRESDKADDQMSMLAHSAHTAPREDNTPPAPKAEERGQNEKSQGEEHKSQVAKAVAQAEPANRSEAARDAAHADKAAENAKKAKDGDKEAAALQQKNVVEKGAAALQQKKGAEKAGQNVSAVPEKKDAANASAEAAALAGEHKIDKASAKAADFAAKADAAAASAAKKLESAKTAAKQAGDAKGEGLAEKAAAAKLEKDTGVKVKSLKMENDDSHEKTGDNAASIKTSENGREVLNVLEGRSRLLRKNLSNSGGDGAQEGKDGRGSENRKSEPGSSKAAQQPAGQENARGQMAADVFAGLSRKFAEKAESLSESKAEAVIGKVTESQARPDSSTQQAGFADASQKAAHALKGAAGNAQAQAAPKAQEGLELVRELVNKMQTTLAGSDKMTPGTKLSLEFDSGAYGHMSMTMRQNGAGLSVSLEVGGDAAKEHLMNQRDELERHMREMGYGRLSLDVSTERENRERRGSNRKGLSGNEDLDNVRLAGDDKFDMAQILNFK